MGPKKRPSAHRTPNAGPATAAPPAAAAAPPAADPPAAVTAALSGDSLQLAVVALSAGLESLRGDLAAQHTAQSTLAAANRALQADNQALAARVQALEAELFRLRCAFDSRQPLPPATPAPPPPAAAPRRAKIKMPPPMAVNAGARNQWDRMPEPVRSRILACSSVLTRFTNGLLMPIELECLSYPEKNDLWYEAIKSEWSGDFHQLPHVFTLNNKTSESITSRSLFNRLPDWLFRFQGLREAIIVRNRWMDLVPGINVEVLADAAARTNAVWMLEDLIVKLKAVQPSSALAESAAASGHLEALKFLRAHTPSGVAWRDRVHYYAASSGNLDVLVWLSANRPEPIPATAFEIAATNGHMHIIEWLSKNFKGECSRPTLNEAARSGHLEMLKFLVKRFPNLAESYKREGYTELDSLPVIQWAHENKCKFDKREALEGLVFRGDIEGLEWMLKTFKMQANEKLLAKACELVQDRVANWLVNVKGVQITSNIVKEAVERSATSVLSVLIRKDRKWRDVAKRFAQSNNREILNWLAARHPA